MNRGEATRSDSGFTPVHSGSPHVWAPHEGVKAGEQTSLATFTRNTLKQSKKSAFGEG